jgi:nitrogenase-stabilizing/protective protein
MTTPDQLKHLSAAEEFFQLLEVPYDPAVLNVARLHILRRMGEYLRRDGLVDADDAAARALCRAHLERAYTDFVQSSPLNERVFKVLKDAIRPSCASLVHLLPPSNPDAQAGWQSGRSGVLQAPASHRASSGNETG